MTFRQMEWSSYATVALAAMRERYVMLGPRAFQVAADAMKRGAQ